MDGLKTILLVEDDADDIFLVKKACERSGYPHLLQVVRDGLEAIHYLSGEGVFADRMKYPLPQLVFLDIQLPGMNGHDVLVWIRADPQFARLPVIMLTISISSIDLQRGYDEGCNSYLRKGDNPAQFAEAMGTAMNYWLGPHIGPKATF